MVLAVTAAGGTGCSSARTAAVAEAVAGSGGDTAAADLRHLRHVSTRIVIVNFTVENELGISVT